MFEAIGFSKYTEEDSYENGCNPKTNRSWSDRNMRFTGETLDDLIQSLMAFVGTDDKESVSLDACDNMGRVDIQVLETDEGYNASKRDIELWKEKKERLWLCNYTFQVEQVERRTISLTE